MKNLHFFKKSEVVNDGRILEIGSEVIEVFFCKKTERFHIVLNEEPFRSFKTWIAFSQWLDSCIKRAEWKSSLEYESLQYMNQHNIK